jgi:hypothetical protein
MLVKYSLLGLESILVGIVEEQHVDVCRLTLYLLIGGHKQVLSPDR